MGPKKFLVATLTTIYGASNKYAGLDAVNWTDTYYSKAELREGVSVRVTNNANGKSVVVKVNDYGPYQKVTVNGKTVYQPHPTRVIDLSKAAFKKISPLDAGIIDVTVTPEPKD